MAEIELEVKHLKFAKSYSISDEKSTIIYGSNGMGKTSIYNAIKGEHPEYAYIDYIDMKNDFIKSKKTTVNINPYAQKHEELRSLQQQNNDLLNLNILKSYKMNKQKDVKGISAELLDSLKANKIIKPLTIKKEKYDELSVVEKESDITFLLKHLESIKKITNLEEDIKIMKEEYLIGILEELDDNLEEETSICPICDSKVLNLKEVIRRKINESKELETELLIEFKEDIHEFENEYDNNKIIERFDKLINLSGIVTDKEIVDYMLLPDFSKLEAINKAVGETEEIEKQVNEANKMMEKSYNNLVNMESNYTKYLRVKFGASVNFDGEKKSINLELEKLPKEHSTGEINLILFTTKIFEFMGGDKSLIILDDPISSYDIINQYKIVFDIVYSNSYNGKNFIIFTHNLNMIDLINTQHSQAFTFKMLDKIGGKIYINDYNYSGKNYKDNINNIMQFASSKEFNNYINAIMVRDNDKKSKIHKLFHYDGIYTLSQEEYDSLSEEEKKSCVLGMSNKYLLDIIENIKEENFINKNYCDLSIYKIMLMLGLRVWIEKQFFDALSPSEKDEISLKQELGEKINYVFSKKQESRIINQYPKLKRRDLMSSKSMLNQNAHYRSQGKPFDYVLNLSVDDIISEIKIVKNMFYINNSIS